MPFWVQRATPVLVCPPDSPYLEAALKLNARISYYPSLTAINDQNAPH